MSRLRALLEERRPVKNLIAPERHGRPPLGNRDVPRLFVAVPIPPAISIRIGDLVADVQRALGSAGQRVRWVQMEGLHVTLRFLGPTPASQVETVGQAVERSAAAAGGPFEIRVGGAGTFPEPTRPRALWLGIRSGATELGQLSSALTRELGSAGWDLDERPFRPHLTIARTDGVHAGADAGSRLIVAAAELDLQFIADEVVLYRSHLGRGPARYEALRTVSLG